MYNETVEWAMRNMPILLNPEVIKRPEAAKAQYLKRIMTDMKKLGH